MQNLFSKKAFLVMLMALTISSLKAITYYISPNGNDQANGTSAATAWKTISKLNGINLLPGIVVLFEGGAYFSGSIYLDAADANDAINPILISSYGTGKATIRSGASAGFFAYNTKGFEISNLVFEGSGMATNTTNGVQIYTDLGGNVKLGNIKLTNVEILHYGRVGLSFYSSNANTGFKDVVVDGIHIHHVRENGLFVGGYRSPTHMGWSHERVEIKNTEVNNIPGYADPNVHRGSGIILAQVDSGSIENCVAHHNGASNTHCGGPGGIWVYDCNGITIQHCESYSNSSGSGCDGLGFDLDGGMQNSVLQYNYSHDNDGAGFLLGQYDNARPWANNVVRYNISENDGRTNAGGITLFKGVNTTMNGCKIYSNTIYTSSSASNPGVGAFTVIDWNTGITGIEVYNNIFQTTGGASLVDIPVGYDAFFAGNLYWSTGGVFKINYHGTNYSSVAAWRNASGKEQVGSLLTGVTADPLLMNVGAGTILWPTPTYSLSGYITQLTSPAINTGLDLGSLFGIHTGATDFFNSVLSASNPADIGAYENPSSMTTQIEGGNASGKNISYYPNPVENGEQIHLAGGVPPYSVELLTINGMTVSKEVVQGQEYLISGTRVASGLYIIRIIDSKDRTTSGKLVVH